MNPRTLWRPRLPIREGGQCAGCPFGKDNDKQFGSILVHIKKKFRINGEITPRAIERARAQVHHDIDVMGGDFACHATVYGAGDTVHPVEEHKQCPGASAYYLKQGEILYQQKEEHVRRSRRKKSA